MFESATLKLTGWYLLIIMVINVIFSVVIYQTTAHELSSRLTTFSQGIRNGVPDGTMPTISFQTIREEQTEQAKRNIIFNLIYTDVIILIAGGIGAYILARHTLLPIERAHRAQSQFTSDASHELRTPLAAMKTELEASLRDKDLSKKEMRELLESNLEEVDKLTSLSYTLLKLAQQDYDSLTHETFLLDTVVRKAVDTYDTSGARIKLTTTHKDLYVDGHKLSIEELATILIDNALKYSPKSSLISIVISKRDDKACLEITNTGAGISAENLPHIFDRFYRADNARSGNGHGLGLSLAKTIVQIHHGELSVSSAPNHATTFTALLPVLGSPQSKPRS